MSKPKNHGNLTVHVFGHAAGSLEVVLFRALVAANPVPISGASSRAPVTMETDSGGSADFVLAEGQYEVSASFGSKQSAAQTVHIRAGDNKQLKVYIQNFPVRLEFSRGGTAYSSIADLHSLEPGQSYTFRISSDEDLGADTQSYLHATGATLQKLPDPVLPDGGHHPSYYALRNLVPGNVVNIQPAMARGPSEAIGQWTLASTKAVWVLHPTTQAVSGDANISLRRTASRMTEDVPLWASIRKGTDALSFERYLDFMEWLFCGKDNPGISGDFSRINRRALPFTDTDAYRNVKFATEAFVMANCGVFTDFDAGDAAYVSQQLAVNLSGTPLAAVFAAHRSNPEAPNILPYLALIRAKLKDQGIKDLDIGEVDISVVDEKWKSEASTCYGILKRRLDHPCLLELIWSYWQEEGMLTQTMNAITRRFQNVRGPMANDPLANTEIDPLRPLNNVLWGYVQDEQHRLSVVRRNYEYDHHYGLRLAGKAVNNIRAADSRSRFLEAFHTLLSVVSAFYKRDDDTTMVADGFPVLNALKEAHLILSQGAHNQFGDLPSTARIEMLMQQWILARPEFREFLPTRIMVAYPEPWMDRVDAMKKLQGWSDTSVLHFRNLAVFGEQVLLSIRYGAWAGVNDPWQAVNWARYWRPEIQGYLHAYRSVTGVDLTVDLSQARIDSTMPSVHLVKRLAEQQRSA